MKTQVPIGHGVPLTNHKSRITNNDKWLTHSNSKWLPRRGREFVHEAVSKAQIPVLGGYIGVLPGHTPLLAEMGIGELSYRVGNRVVSCTAIGGFVEVLADRVIVLADSAERAEEIDVARARGRPRPRPEAPRRLPTIRTWIGSAPKSRWSAPRCGCKSRQRPAQLRSAGSH